MSEYVLAGGRWSCAHVVTRYLLEHIDWLEEELGGFDDDYLIIDCPGPYRRSSFSLRAHVLQAKSSFIRITHSCRLLLASCSAWT